MAWDPLPGGGYGGDEPSDILAAALDRLAAAYEARFGRRPTLYEVAHTFETVLGAKRHDVLHDPQRVDTLRHAVPPSGAPLPPDPAEYEASWSEAPPPDGTYWVTHRATGVDALRCVMRDEPEAGERALAVAYEVLAPGLDDAAARALVLATVIGDFTGYAHAGEADVVLFSRLADAGDAGDAGAGERVVVPYPRGGA